MHVLFLLDLRWGAAMVVGDLRESKRIQFTFPAKLCAERPDTNWEGGLAVSMGSSRDRDGQRLIGSVASQPLVGGIGRSASIADAIRSSAVPTWP